MKNQSFQLFTRENPLQQGGFVVLTDSSSVAVLRSQTTKNLMGQSFLKKHID